MLADVSLFAMVGAVATVEIPGVVDNEELTKHDVDAAKHFHELRSKLEHLAREHQRQVVEHLRQWELQNFGRSGESSSSLVAPDSLTKAGPASLLSLPQGADNQLRESASNGPAHRSILGDGLKEGSSSMGMGQLALKGKASQKAHDRMMKSLHRSSSKKFKADKRHADDYVTERARLHAELYESGLERIVTSLAYEWTSIGLIILNAIFIGLQTQIVMIEAMERGKQGKPMQDAADSELVSWFLYVHLFFCIVFIVDLALRWYVDGWFDFFMTSDWGWNVFDFAVVVASALELAIDLATGHSMIAYLSVFRVLRIVRVLRVLRVIRKLYFFRELRMMMYTLLQSLRPLMWVSLTFVLMFFIFGMFFTLGVYEYCQRDDTWDDADTFLLRKFFGRLDWSALSLYQAITGGRDWFELYDALFLLPPTTKYVFFLYVLFATIAALNVITGIFVESAMQMSKLDQHFVIQEELNNKEKYVVAMHMLFEEMDVTSDGCISLEEFEQHANDERAVAYFSAWDIDFNDARYLFCLLDADQSGMVDFEEFLSGCERLRGQARNIDLAMLRYEVHQLSNMILTGRSDLSPSPVLPECM